MREELNPLNKNKMWEIVDLPKEKSVIGCIWTYKVKYDSEDKVDRLSKSKTNS